MYGASSSLGSQKTLHRGRWRWRWRGRRRWRRVGAEGLSAQTNWWSWEWFWRDRTVVLFFPLIKVDRCAAIMRCDATRCYARARSSFSSLFPLFFTLSLSLSLSLARARAPARSLLPTMAPAIFHLLAPLRAAHRLYTCSATCPGWTRIRARYGQKKRVGLYVAQAYIILGWFLFFDSFCFVYALFSPTPSPPALPILYENLSPSMSYVYESRVPPFFKLLIVFRSYTFSPPF
jgi:hypothetical protein